MPVRTARSLATATMVLALLTCGFHCDPDDPKQQVPNSDIQMKFVNFSGVAMQVEVTGEHFNRITVTVGNEQTLNMEEPGYAGDTVTIKASASGLSSQVTCMPGENMVSPATAYGQVTLGIGGGVITIDCDDSWLPETSSMSDRLPNDPR